MVAETTDPSHADGLTIASWIDRNLGIGVVVDNHPDNPPFVPQSNNGEKSIVGYVSRQNGDARVLTEDLAWMNGQVTDVPAARDLPGTSGVNLTTHEFLNDLMLSGAISPYEHFWNSKAVLDTERSNDAQQSLVFKIGHEIPFEDQNGNLNKIIYVGLRDYGITVTRYILHRFSSLGKTVRRRNPGAAFRSACRARASTSARRA